MRMEVSVTGPRSVTPALKRRMRRAALAAVTAIPARTKRSLLGEGVAYALSVAVVSDRKMRALNRSYRGKDRTTDVLSFSRLEGEGPRSPEAEIGDILISFATAKAQAKDYGAPLGEELERLVVHGVLHLFGYDHEADPREAKRMFRLQNRVLRSLH